MKYILITLLSFTFATQITTREFEVLAPNGDTIDIYAISGLEYGKVEIVPYFEDGIGQVQIYGDAGHMLSCYWGMCYDDIFGPGHIMFNSSYPGLYFEINGENEFDNIESTVLTLWITGEFEDEDSSMGDMNNDGSLNVYDVLILVGIILDGDSGDIFDVMEIIKRV